MICLLRLRDIEIFAVLFNSSIPNVVVIKDNILYAVELTVFSETNFSKNQNYKINGYENLWI